MSSDLQLFTVQPIAIQQVIPGIHAVVYSRAALNQDELASKDDKIEASELIYEQLVNQLDLSDDIHLMTLGSKEQVYMSEYGRTLQRQLQILVDRINFKECLMFLRVDNKKLPKDFVITPLKQDTLVN